MTDWGTFTYGVIAGVCGAIALVFLLIGLRRRSDDLLMVSFGAYALVSSIMTVATITLHSSSTVADYIDAFEVFGLAAYASSIALFGLVAVWTRAVSRRTLIVWYVVTGAVGIAQVMLTDGLLAGPIEGLRTVSLFGDEFTVHVASRAQWRWVLDLWLVGTLGVMASAMFRGYRAGERETATVMSAALVINMLFAVWDSAVDSGAADTPYLSPVGSLVVMLGGAAYLSERSVRTERRLANQTGQLEELVVNRTEALRESNRRLAEELLSQQRMAQNLALLTSEFESSNELSHSRPTAVDSLQSMVDLLAAVVPADRVELRVDEAVLPAHADTLFVGSSEATSRSPDAAPDLSDTIQVNGQEVGSLRAWLGDAESPHSVEPKYLRLAAEHLSGMFERIELIREISDSAVEVERQRIARDLHDSVTQRMYSVSFLADALVHLADDDPASLAGTARRIRELVLSSLVELRSLLFELRPEAFTGTTLSQLIGQLGEHATATSEVEVAVDAHMGSPLPPDIKVGLYRIAQEALSNSCRHSGGSHAEVTLREAAGLVSLVVSDDGQGFDLSGDPVGHGLGNLRDRAASIGGDIDIATTPGAGTTIEVRWARPSLAVQPAEPERQA